ncbi:hydroxycarboxylic acid receptor 2-like [Conger conger]|uniref:hydroxycarboxylic acid receptor 2-like n=1 Tax=Conger conger TaxID=82655 RepID=UPI002A5A9BE7|nr:hydroxycarboxylic acid receptor 2-like [Conger conger]
MDNKSCLAPQALVATVVPPVMIIEFLLGLPGNVMALWIFCCRLQAWRSNTVYLLNLMVADFLLLAAMPLRIDTLLRGENWIFGDTLCRIDLFLLTVNRSASISFLTIVAVDRYFKVVHPHHQANRMTAQQAGLLAGAVWAAVVLVRVPLLSNRLLWNHGNQSFCRSFSSSWALSAGMWLHYVMYLAEFFLPFLLLVFCAVRISCTLRLRGLVRARQVRRAVRVVLVIVAVFTLCFLPGVTTYLAALLIHWFQPQDCEAYLLAGELFSLSLGFTYLNSALDPVIYCFSSSTFRNGLSTSINAVGFFGFDLGHRDSTTSNRREDRPCS